MNSLTDTPSTFDGFMAATYSTISPHAKFILACNRCVGVIRAEAEPLAHDPVRVAIKRFTFSRDAGFSLRDIGTIFHIPTVKGARPGKFTKPTDEPAESVVRSFFEKGEAYSKLTDEAVWQAALDYANEVIILTAQDARTLEDSLNLALLARAGVVDVPSHSLYAMASMTRGAA